MPASFDRWEQRESRNGARSVRAFWRSLIALGIGAVLATTGCGAPPSTLASPTAVEGVPTNPPATATAASAVPVTPIVVPTSVPAATTVPVDTPTPPAPSPTAIAATSTPAAVNVPTDGDGVPRFSDVSQKTPRDVIAYLRGQLPGYPNGGPDAAIDFSPSDILETMDTAVLDQVRSQRGGAALQRVYDVIAQSVLDSLRDQYGDHWILVPLDAGHGGKKGFNWDAGSEGTEAEHTRGVVAAMQRLASQQKYRNIILRPIFNDAIADDFGLPAPRNRSTVNVTLMRQARASMLAAEAAAWNQAHPEPAAQVMVHEISVHFNAGAGGALVLHQGDTVRPEYASRSLDFAKRYLKTATAALNATGLLPSPLHLWGGDGLHDDVMMYRPAGLSAPASGAVLRYGALQGHGYLPRFIAIVLAR